MREWRDLRLYFRALADVRRLRIVSELVEAPEVSVKELCLRLRASQPLVSWHLRVLVRSGLVRTRKQGRQVFCSLHRPGFENYQERLGQMLSKAPSLEVAARDDVAPGLVTPPPLPASS